MSLNVNYNSLYKNGIDTSILKDVSQEILRRAAQKNAHYTNSASVHQVNAPAKPLELGIDLYQGKVDTNVQRQIAMNNTLQFQLNESTINSIQYLNSQAAVVKKVDGKFMPIVNEAIETQKVNETNASQFVQIFTAATAKDKDGSNPFYNGELLAKKSKKEEQNESDSLKSIFS
ncbi:MAG: hypothetical protein E7Z87_04890 [Cyanobacteria bacterium SIG26]|nr:hypothetical protein [Cyanobacteria bacterium SIG26]MBQ7126285.1 hypothetical protein [bacterium]